MWEKRMKFTVLCSNKAPIKEFFSRTTCSCIIVPVLKIFDVMIQVMELTGMPKEHHIGT
jgi:hypothetical protein